LVPSGVDTGFLVPRPWSHGSPVDSAVGRIAFMVPAKGPAFAGKQCRVHRPLSIVVFVNPRSRANRRDPQLATRFAQTLGDAGRVIAPVSLDDLLVQARALAQTPPDVIGIHGGDGTLHRAVAALIHAFGDRPLPPI